MPPGPHLPPGGVAVPVAGGGGGGRARSVIVNEATLLG